MSVSPPIAALAATPRKRETDISALLIPTILTAVSFVVFSVYSINQWNSFAAPSWDLGIFSQLAKAYANFSEPIVPIKGDGFNLLGDHFHPILVLLGPVWKLWPSGLSLLLVQNLLFAISVWPITRLAIERLGTVWGGLLGFGYAIAWGLQSAVVSQFHEIAFAVPLVAFGLVAYLRGKWLASAILIGLLVFVKEDFGVTVALFGAILALRNGVEKDTRRKIGIALLIWGVVWFVLSTWVILPALNIYSAYDYTGRLGHPLSVFWPPIKWATAALLATTAGIVGIRSPLILLIGPTLAWRFLGSVAFYWDWHWHYSAILMPMAIAALLDVVARTRESKLGAPAEPGPRARDGRAWVRGAVVLSVATTLALSPTTLLGQITKPVHALPPATVEHARAVVEEVEEGATVMAGLTFLAYLVPKAQVYWYGNDHRAPDYYVIHEGRWPAGGNSPGEPWRYGEDKWGERYEVAYEGGGFVLLKRPGSAD